MMMLEKKFRNHKLLQFLPRGTWMSYDNPSDSCQDILLKSTNSQWNIRASPMNIINVMAIYPTVVEIFQDYVVLKAWLKLFNIKGKLMPHSYTITPTSWRLQYTSTKNKHQSYTNLEICNHAGLCLPVVTSFLIPLTEIVAPFIPFPSPSVTTPFIPRWTCSGTGSTMESVLSPCLPSTFVLGQVFMLYVCIVLMRIGTYLLILLLNFLSFLVFKTHLGSASKFDLTRWHQFTLSLSIIHPYTINLINNAL